MPLGYTKSLRTGVERESFTVRILCANRVPNQPKATNVARLNIRWFKSTPRNHLRI